MQKVGNVQILEDMPATQIDHRPGLRVYQTAKAKGFSYMVTIPKAYALEMELDGRSFVTARLMEEDTDVVIDEKKGTSVKKKKVYCIIEKLETS